MVTWLTFLVPDMVLYLCVLGLYNMVTVFGIFSTSWNSWGCASGVSALIVPTLILLFSCFGCNCWYFSWLSFFIVSPPRFACYISSGYASSIVTLGSYARVIECFTRYGFLIVFFLFTCWSFYGYASSIVILGVSAGEVAFPKVSDRDLNALFFHLLVWLLGWQVLDFVVHELDIVSAWMVSYVADIFGMLNLLGGIFTVSEICSALVLGMHALCHL